MDSVQKLIVPVLCAALMVAMQPVRQAMSAEAAPTESKSAPTQQQSAHPTAAPENKKTTEAAPSDPKEVVAKVGNAVITRADLNRAVAVFMRQNPPGQQLTAEQTTQVDNYLLEQLIAADLLYQAGQKVEVKDLEKQIDEKVAQGKARFATTEEFDKALKAQDLDEKLLREYTRKEILVNNLIEKEIVPKVTVSDEEIKKFYDDNKDRYFHKPEQVRASHILIGVDEKADAETKKKAKEKAEALLKEIKAGKDFAELAKANSTCPSSAQGGDLGFFGKGQMVPSFEQAAFGLKPGEVSGVVETQFGYHIIKLTDKKPAENITLDEAKPKIVELLKNQKIQTKVAEYIKELHSKIKVEKLLK